MAQTFSLEDVEGLRRALKAAEAKAAEVAEETPHTRLLGQLADHVVHPVMLGDALNRVFVALDLLGVDLLAEDGPARKATKVTTPAPEVVVDPAGGQNPEGVNQ